MKNERKITPNRQDLLYSTLYVRYTMMVSKHLLVKNTNHGAIISSFLDDDPTDLSNDLIKEDVLSTISSEKDNEAIAVRSGKTVVIGRFTVIAQTSAVADEFEKAFSKPFFDAMQHVYTHAGSFSISFGNGAHPIAKNGLLAFKPRFFEKDKEVFSVIEQEDGTFDVAVARDSDCIFTVTTNGKEVFIRSDPSIVKVVSNVNELASSLSVE